MRLPVPKPIIRFGDWASNATYRGAWTPIHWMVYIAFSAGLIMEMISGGEGRWYYVRDVAGVFWAEWWFWTAAGAPILFFISQWFIVKPRWVMIGHWLRLGADLGQFLIVLSFMYVWWEFGPEFEERGLGATGTATVLSYRFAGASYLVASCAFMCVYDLYFLRKIADIEEHDDATR